MSCILMSCALELFVKQGKQIILHPHVLHPHVGYIRVIRKVRKTQHQNPKFGRLFAICLMGQRRIALLLSLGIISDSAASHNKESINPSYT
jgi:hypothetical protein